MHDGIGLSMIDSIAKVPPEYPLPHDPAKTTRRAHTIFDQTEETRLVGSAASGKE